MTNVLCIPLANNKGEAIIDVADADLVTQYKWHAAKGYAIAAGRVDGRRKTISMHRIILAAPDGQEVDHINGDRLDNRRANLRLVSRADNMKNKRAYGGSSVFKGVNWRERAGKWIAQIQVDGKCSHIGQFDSELDAAWHYNREAARLFGEFARLNDVGDYCPTLIKVEKKKRQSLYRHVSWNKTNKRWAVIMVIDGRNRFIAQFKDQHEAGQCAVEQCRARGGKCC